MLEKFIDETKTFLKQTDLKLHDLEFSEIKMNENGGITYFTQTSDNFRQVKIAENFLFHTLVFFSFIDAKVDTMIPQLEGKSFATRYKRLSTVDDESIIFKECYRILKLVRNASTHERSKLTMSEEGFNVQYKHKNNDYHLQISQKGLELIYTFLIGNFVPENFPSSYKMAVMRGIFYDIHKETIIFKDEFGERLMNIPSGLKLQRSRLRVLNTNAIQVGATLKISTEDIKYCPIHERFDYMVEFEDNIYLIPDELLTKEKTILIKNIFDWRYE